MRAGAFKKSITKVLPKTLGDKIWRALGKEIWCAVEEAFTEHGERDYDGPTLYKELYPYFVLFDEHKSIAAPNEKNRQDLTEDMKAVKQRVMNPAMKRYRTSVLGWLSQIHPDQFYNFIRGNNINLNPLTEKPSFRDLHNTVEMVHRNANKRSAARLKRIGWKVPTLDLATELKTQSRLEQERGSPPIKVPLGETKKENQATVATSKPNHLPLALIGLVIVAFLSWAAWSGLGNNGTGDQSKAKTATSVETAINEPTEENSVNDVNEADDVQSDPAQPQSETDNIIEKPETPIDPIWDEITDREWSVGKLTTIRKYVQRASLSDLQQAADEGNINAATLLAFAYHFGELGLPHDFSKEREYARPACQEGQARACMLVGVNFSTAESHGNDDEMASIFYRRACDLGSGIGCLYIGQRFQSGFDGIEKDKNAALKAYDTACREGISRACRYAELIRTNPTSLMTSGYAWRQSDGRAFNNDGVAVGWYRNGYIVDDNGRVIAKVE